MKKELMKYCVMDSPDGDDEYIITYESSLKMARKQLSAARRVDIRNKEKSVYYVIRLADSWEVVYRVN